MVRGGKDKTRVIGRERRGDNQNLGQLNLTVGTMGSGGLCGLGKRGRGGDRRGEREKKNQSPLFFSQHFNEI